MQHMPMLTDEHLPPLGLNMGALNVNTVSLRGGMGMNSTMVVETKANICEIKGGSGAEKENQMFQCKVCLARFKKEKYLREHKRNCQPTIIKRTLQERLVHLLALGPLKFLQVQAAVPQDTLLVRDKNRLKQVLHSVAEFRNNAFELRRTMWVLVREDWPFFSEEQRCIVRRSRPSKLTPKTPTPPRTSTSPSLTPDQTSKQKDSNKQTEKTHLLEGEGFSPYEVPKGRVAHVKQPLEDREFAQQQQQQGVSPHETRRTSPGLKLTPGTSPIAKVNLAVSTSPMIAPRSPPPMIAQRTPPPMIAQRTPPPMIAQRTPPIQETKLPAEELSQEGPINLVVRSDQDNLSNCNPVTIEESSDRGDLALATATAAAEERHVPRVETSPKTEPNLTLVPSPSAPAPLTQLQPNKSRDFLTEFTAIETEEQKGEYRDLYSKGLAVYREQYQVIDSYNQLSEQLAKKLKSARAKADQAKMEKVKEAVRRRFKEMQEDARCQAALANFQHLHEKLGHIRMLMERRLEEERVAGLVTIEQPGDTMPIFA